MRKQVLIAGLCSLLVTLPVSADRYSPRTAEPYTKTEYSIKVNNMPLKDFLKYLSGLTRLKIVLLEKNANDFVSFVGKGSITEILDTILVPLGYYYELRGDEIVVGKYVSRVWKIDIPAVKKNFALSKSGGKGSLEYSVSHSSDLGRTIVEMLKPFIRDRNSRIAFEPTTGLLTFYGTYREAQAIEGVVRKISEFLTKAIKLKVDVYAVNLRKGYETGIDLKAIMRMGLGKISLTSTSAGSPVFSAGIQTSRADVLLALLETYGRLTRVESREFTAISGFPIVYSSGTQTYYLRNVSIGYITPTGGAATSTPTLNIQTDELVDGTEFILVPNKLVTGELSLDVVFSLKKVKGIEEKTFKVQGQETTLQLPTVEYGDFAYPTKLSPGEELLLLSTVIDEKDSRREGFPFLSRIPLLKYLFGKHSEYSSKVQLLVRIRYEVPVEGEYLVR